MIVSLDFVADSLPFVVPLRIAVESKEFGLVSEEVGRIRATETLRFLGDSEFID